MNRFFFNSIKGKLFLTLIILLTGGLLIQILYIAPAFQKRKTQEIKIAQNRLAEYLAAQISSSLTTAVREMEAMASLPVFLPRENGPADDAVATLNSANHFFNYFFILDPRGAFLTYPTRPDLIGTTIPAENMGWVNQTLETGQTVPLDVVKSKIGTLVSGFSTPVRNEKNDISAILRGVVVISEDNALVQIIRRANLLRHSQTYLVSSRGWLIAHSHRRLDYDAFNEYDMSGFAPVRKALAGHSGIETYEYGGQQWIASFYPVGITNWGLIVQQPLEEVISAAAKEARLIILAILGCFFVGLTVAAFWVQRSLVPLFKLVRDIQTGSFGSQNGYPRDEIGQLAAKYQKLFTDLHESRQRIQMSETKFRTLFNSASDAIYIIDSRGRFLEVNHQATVLTKYSRDELLTMSIADICDPESEPADREGARHGNGDMDQHIFETRHRTRTGEWIPVEISSSRIEYGHEGAVLRVARDLTERKRFEEHLRQSQKMEAIGTLAGGIAHDFNNILAGIFGFSQLAKKHLGDPEKAEKKIDQIVAAAQKASELVQQILTVSRKSIDRKQPVAVYLILKEALKLLRASIPATIKITENLSSRDAVMADPGKIHQVIMNLCTNAYHAMDETGGTLTVSLNPVDDSERDRAIGAMAGDRRFLCLMVQDTGSGMSPAVVQKIFDPYFTTKAPGKGTGLGLAMVFSIVEEYSGFIRVHSEPGKGSAFYVYLPVVDQPAPVPVLKKESLHPLTGSETIMLIDDEAPLREVTGDLLRGLGYVIHPFPDGVQAFEAYRTDPFRYDLIITDMTMPGITGMALARQIFTLRPDQPVILCTGYSESINRETAMAEGIAGYIEKPFAVRALAETIRKIIDPA